MPGLMLLWQPCWFIMILTVTLVRASEGIKIRLRAPADMALHIGLLSEPTNLQILELTPPLIEEGSGPHSMSPAELRPECTGLFSSARLPAFRGPGPSFQADHDCLGA